MKTRNLFLATAAILVGGAITAKAEISSVQDDMLQRFVKYASIDSQSSYDSAITAGQLDMAQAIKAEADSLAAAYGYTGYSSQISDKGYVYLEFAPNTVTDCATVGISCHLDVTPEAQGGKITPIVDRLDGQTIVRTDGTTLLGADDKCGCTIAMQLVKEIVSNPDYKHGKVLFAFCPNEDVGRAADGIDATVFNPDVLFDLDGTGGKTVTKANFTARGMKVGFKGHQAHPGNAKALGMGDALAAAAEFISGIPVRYRPENTEGHEGYIHPWNLTVTGDSAVVDVRIRYFDKDEGELFDSWIKADLKLTAKKHPNVRINVLEDGIQYENVAYTLYPGQIDRVTDKANELGYEIELADERGGTTASMFAAKGLKGGMCIFTGQHNIHSTSEYAALNEMEKAFRLIREIVREYPATRS